MERAIVLYKLGLCKALLGFSNQAVLESYEQGLLSAKKCQSMTLEKLLLEKINFLKQGISSIDTTHTRDLNVYDSGSDSESSQSSDFDIAEEFEKIIDNNSTRTSIDVPNLPKTRSKSKNPIFNPNKKNDLGETLLHISCIKGQYKIVLDLLEKGADVNLRDNCGWLPLHEACNHGHLEIVQLLLDHGSDLNDSGGINCDGVTPLIDAAENLHLQVVKLLLDRGANPKIADNHNRTALSILLQKGDEIEDEDRILFEQLINWLKQTKTKEHCYIPVNEPPKRNLKSSKKLVAISDERIPLILAINEKENLSLQINDKNIQFKNIEKPQSETSPIHRSKRKRVFVMSSDEETIPSNKMNFNNEIHDARACQKFNTELAYYVLTKEDKQLIICKSNQSKNSFDLIKYVQKSLNLDSLSQFSICLIVNQQNILFPNFPLPEYNSKNNPIICLKLYNLKPEEIYEKISCFTRNPMIKSLKDFLSSNKKISPLPYQLKSFSKETDPFIYTLLSQGESCLNFSSIPIKINRIVFFAQILKFFTVKELILSNTQLSIKSLEEFVKIIHSTTFDIFSLDLSFNDFSGEPSKTASVLFNFLKSCPKIEILNLAYCNISNVFDASFHLTNYFQEKSSLINLNLSGNIFEEDAFKVFLNYGLPWNEFKSLNFSHIAMTFDPSIPLSLFFKLSKCSVSSLDLSINPNLNGISSLLSNPDLYIPLTELNISGTNQTQTFSSFLFKNMANFSNLKRLIIYDNPELFNSFDDLFIFIQFCLNSTSLEYIDLSNTIQVTQNNSLSPSIRPINDLNSNISAKFNLQKVILNHNSLDYSSTYFYFQKYRLDMFLRIELKHPFCQLIIDS